MARPKRCPVTGKIKHRDAAAASRWVEAGERMRVYRCRHCRAFHLTSGYKKANA